MFKHSGFCFGKVWFLRPKCLALREDPFAFLGLGVCFLYGGLMDDSS